MTVETQTKKVNLPSSASTFTYSFSPIVIFASSDIVVTITNDTTGVETVLSEGTTSSTYTVVVSSFPGTGSITYPGDSGTEAGTGSTINIKRVLTLEQTTDFENQGGYFPDTLEEALDKGVMRDLQQQEEIDRSFKASPGEQVLSTFTLPNTDTVTSGSAAALGLDTDHTKIVFTASSGTLPDPVTVARGGTGGTTAAVARTGLGVVIGTDVQAFDTDTTKNDVANTYTAIQRYTKGGDIASASPLVLDTDGNYFDVTGTTGFSQITCTTGDFFMLQFDSALTMTDGANLNLGGANITTATGDRGLFYATATNTAQLISWVEEGNVVIQNDLEFVSTAALTTATTIEVNNFVTGYDYIVTLEAFAPTDDSESLWLRFSDDAAVSFEAGAADYKHGNMSSSNYVFDVSDAQIAVTGTNLFGNDSDNQSYITFSFLNPNATSERTTVSWTGGFEDDTASPQIRPATGMGIFLQGTDAVEDIQFLWSGGSTFKAQGDITVWRRKRS